MTKTFAERCHIAQQFLPDAQYKAMLTALHTEMLAKLAEQPAPAAQQEPVAWANPNDLQNFDMKVRTNGGPLHTVPLYTTPQAQPAREFVGLTDEEIEQGCKESWVTEQAWQSAVWWAEDKLMEKNT